MSSFKQIFIVLLVFSSFRAAAQIPSLIGTTEEFILENVKGYASVQQRGIEHEEFEVLVFEDKERELSFHFTFYRGEKVCNYIKSEAPLSTLKKELDFIHNNFNKVSDKIWENKTRTVQVQINEVGGQVVMVVKGIRR